MHLKTNILGLEDTESVQSQREWQQQDARVDRMMQYG